MEEIKMSLKEFYAIKKALSYGCDIIRKSAEVGYYPPAALSKNGGDGLMPFKNALLIMDEIYQKNERETK